MTKRLTDQQQIMVTDANRALINAADYVTKVNTAGNEALDNIKKLPGGINGNKHLVVEIQHQRIDSLKRYNFALCHKHDLMEHIFIEELHEVNVATELILEIVNKARADAADKFINIDDIIGKDK